MMNNPWDHPHEFPPPVINTKGVKFWLNKDLTDRAKHLRLKGHRVLFSEMPNGVRSHLIVEGENIIH